MEVFVNLVGVSFRPAEAREVVKSLTPDSGPSLRLECEPDNPYDSNAVKVMYISDSALPVHIGYLARENNYEVFTALERGDELNIEIVGFENTMKPTLLITDPMQHFNVQEDDEELDEIDE